MNRRASSLNALAVAALGSLALCGSAAAAPAPKSVKVSSCTEQALRDAVAGAPSGAVVRFACDGTITLTPGGGGMINVTTNGAAERKLTLDGNGRDVTLSGGGETRILAVDGGVDLTLRRLTLRDGVSSDAGFGGGAVLALGGLTADRVEFRDNRAFESGGAIHTSGAGARLAVSNSRFVGNSVTCSLVNGGGGGAIAVTGTQGATVRNSTFADNFATGAGAGGAIAVLPPRFGPESGAALTVTGTRFERNSTDGLGTFYLAGTVVGGGAIGVVDRGLKVVRSEFVDNRAASSLLAIGGAISATSSPRGGGRPAVPFSVTHSVLEGNEALGRPNSFGTGSALGGAVFLMGNFTGAKFVITEMVGNSAGSGGALMSTVKVTIDRSLVERNVSTGGAGEPDGALVSTGVTRLVGTRLIDNTPVACVPISPGRFVDGGRNVELGSSSCFGG